MKEAIYNLMMKHFKAWAYRISEGAHGYTVYVKRGNVDYVKQLLKDSKIDNVDVKLM